MKTTAAVLALVLATATIRVAPADNLDESLAELRATAGPQLSYLEAEGQPVLRFLAGRLTVSPAVDLRAAGRDFLGRHGAALGLGPGTALAVERELPLSSGAVLRYRARIAGVPVVGGEVALRFDRDGILRIVNSGLRPFSRIDPPEPLVGSAAAAATAVDLPHVVAPADPEELWAGLVYLPMGDEALLAWQVETGRVPALMANWVTWVDARTGKVLASRNRVWLDRLATVFEQNPVVTPTAIQVTLEDLPPWTEDPYYLTGELILSRNCIDRHELTPLTYMGYTINVHICTETQVAQGDASHDFLYTDNTDTAPEDLFAEAAMFYHANKVYDFYQTLGFDRLNEVPLRASVNFRIPVDLAGGFDLANLTNPNGTLYPMDNAMFMPAGDSGMFIPRDSDSMVFGQGTRSDFSYDGDIVYHEFTHAVIDSTSALEAATVDDQGLDIGPGALNEGYADVFAMFMTGNPEMGEYGGAGLATGGMIRNLENDKRCPDDMIGEVHEDSQPWASAAWELYDLYGDPIVQPYYDAMVSLTSQADFAVAVRDTLAEIEAQVDAATAAGARAEFERRNIVSCVRAIEGGAAPHPQLLGEGTGSVGLGPYVPGYMMFHVVIPGGQRQVRLSFDAAAGGLMGGSIAPYVLFKKGSERLRFSYGGTTVHDDSDYAVAATEVADGEYEAVYCEAGELEAGDYWAMIANTGSGQMQMQQISLRYNDSTPDVPCVGVDPDAGDGGGDAPEDVPEEAQDTVGDGDAGGDGGLACEPVECAERCRTAGQPGGECRGEGADLQCVCTSDEGGGCGCRATGATGAAAGWLLLLAAGVLLALRRRG
ncbi:MAG: M36 family metallopeptidase [Deltaproteobacteria bacterium]|nr:M36 family metallopeptidase [Deltaproteobacteria bacterium]